MALAEEGRHKANKMVALILQLVQAVSRDSWSLKSCEWVIEARALCLDRKP